MKLFTLKEFTQLMIDEKCKGLDNRFHSSIEKDFKKRYNIFKSKSVVKSTKQTLLDENNIPYEKIIKGTTKQVFDTNKITKLIVDYLRYVYGSKSIRRISSEGKYRVGIGYIRSENKGLSDIEGIVNGKFLSLELKIGKDQIRESQLKRKREIENDGGIYYLCKWESFEQFQEEIQKLIPIE
jgi:hypothetical protein